MAGCALDPTAELRIWVPDTNFDFEVFKPRCASYVMGADDESMKAIRDQLVNVHEEVQRRGQLLIDFEIPAVTRELASAGVGLHPLICLLEEAHVAITHETYGKEISKLAGGHREARPQARHSHDHLDPGTDQGFDAARRDPQLLQRHRVRGR